MKRKIISVFIFLCFIKLILADEKRTQINLDQIVVGIIDKDNSFDFYELVLPRKIPSDNILVITARENKIMIENEEIFSDPDIYISKKNINPKGRKESDWHSETFGNDIITIPSKEIKVFKRLYLSLFCEKKCRYKLKAYLTKEIEFFLGQVNTIKLSKHNSINYFLKIQNENYEQLKIVAYSPEQKHFHILMSKNNKTPSTQATIEAIPSWMGGYMININKKSKHYCTNCVYHLLFQTEEESTTIKFYAFFQNTFTLIYSNEPLMDSIERNITRCYSYDLNNKKYFNSEESDEDKKLIIQMTLFGGEAFLHISGWNKQIYEDIKDIKKLENYGFQIISEKSIMISKKDIDKFNKEYEEGKEGEKNKLHFCIYGMEKGSYMLTVNSLDEVVSLQKYNYIFPGHEKNGFLPEKQITSYKIIDNSINKNSNITISLKNIQGRSQLYGYFCDSKNDLYCSFGEYKLDKKIESNEILLTEDQYSSSLIDNSIFIESKDNKCYSDTSSKDCKLIAIVKCLVPENKICAFSLISTITNIPIMMTPKKTYYNFISTGKNDIYEIVITEPKINSLVVVLTTNIGNAELSISKKNDNEKQNINNKDSTKFIAMSDNEYSLPDVIRVTPQIINSKNLVGEYIITVSCKFFSSYNLYYYTTKPKSKKNKITSNDITSTLTEGHIITDYFPNNLEYKIYSYTPGDKTAKDIKIILTRVNVRFTFYVFLSLKDIKFNDNIVSVYDERISGYKWISDSNNEVTISKNDKNYKKKATYYIVVLRDHTTNIDNSEDENIDDKLLLMYYLGVTKEGMPFYLKEGIEHRATLNNNYRYQHYIFNHYNNTQPFQLLVNILNGQVDLFISNKELQFKDLTAIYDNIIKDSSVRSMNIKYNNTTIYTQQEISDYAKIIFKNFEENNNKMDNRTYKITLYIYIIQSRVSLKYERDSQYIITAKTSFNKGISLLSGHVYKNKLLSNSEEYFIIEEVKHRDSLTITARFNKGTGDIYAKLIDNNEEIKLKELPFPNSTYFDYKGTSIYMGKVIQIPGEYFDKIGKTILKLKILITISARTYIQNNKEIEYYISYSDEAKRVNQNIPYQSSIREGEFQYYTFYFDKNTENILISLSNMNGDADMFLNYGNNIYPTPLECDWYSNSLGHEYININKNDNYFKKNNIDNLSGYYTLLVIGYTDTTYTLFVSSHDEKVFKLVDNIGTNCKCETKDDKCYFRYDNILNKRDKQNNNTNIKSTEIIFTSQYLYGNGKMYASVLKEQDIYSNTDNKKYLDYFPTEQSNDANNAEVGKRNYLKIRIPESKYSIDSLILMTFVCEEKTDVEITASPLIPSGDFKYLSGERENIFYLKYNESLPQNKQPQTTLAYYSYKDTDSIYEFHVYLGKAKIHIYTNESKWNNITKSFYYEYNHISEFVIQSKLDQNELQEYKYQKYFTEEYFNTISSNLCKGKTVLFSVLPFSNFGFYIQITNDRTWINVPIGKDKTYYVKNRVLYGYFDIFEDFSSVEISIYLKEYISKRAMIYLKIIVDNKIKKTSQIYESNDQDKLKHYEIPGSNNYDYTAKTDNYLGAMNINIENIPVIEDKLRNQKIVRALFAIHIFNNYYIPYGYENSKGIIAPENEAQVTPYINRFDFDLNQESTVNILVTPGVNNFKRIDTVPYTFYFSNTSLMNNNNNNLNNNNNNKIYNGNKEIKIYSLDKISDQDNKMIIQINTCSGEYDIKISSKVVNYDDNSNDISYQELSAHYGRKIFLLDKLRHKHIYVSIKSKQIEEDCNQGLKMDSNNITCSKELSYLLHYYSATDKQYYSAEPNRKLSFRSGNTDNQLILILPKLKEFDYHNNYIDKKNIEYNLFWTYNRTYSSYIESICYLGHFMDEKEETSIYLLKNIQINDKNEYLMDNINPEKPIYINVLARNIKTNELILFKPIKGFLKPSKLSTFLSVTVAIIFICLIMYISWYYYNEDSLAGYELTNSNDLRKDEIKYTNLSLGPI